MQAAVPRGVDLRPPHGQGNALCFLFTRSPTHRACDMDKIIVYVDDADHAQQLLAPLVAPRPAHQRHWVLVALCAHDAPRQQMGATAPAKAGATNGLTSCSAQIIPGAGLQPSGDDRAGQNPLAELTEQLQSQTQQACGRPAQVLDARKPHGHRAQIGVNSSAERPSSPSRPGVLGSVLTGCSTLWALALD